MMSTSITSANLRENIWNETDQVQLQEVEKQCLNLGIPRTQFLVLVNVGTQRLHLLNFQARVASYPVSTAKNGVGQIENTGKTPLGLHKIVSKIGEGAEPYAVFKFRTLTGATATLNSGDDQIVARILWLQGLEPGFNLGKNENGQVVDSHDRYIYIHGTNEIKQIGTVASAGCIRMMPEDVIALFLKTDLGTMVHIYQT
jgi:hypothetical protein